MIHSLPNSVILINDCPTWYLNSVLPSSYPKLISHDFTVDFFGIL